MDTEGLDDDDSDFSEDEDSPGKSLSTQELDRNPVDRHAFLFHRNGGSSGPDLDELRPLPSQIPFLLTVFTESVHSVVQVVHIPTVQNMIRDHRNSGAPLAPADEALMFAIYYASLTSMEEDDVSLFRISTKPLNTRARTKRVMLHDEHLLTLPTGLGNQELWYKQSQPQPSVPSRRRARLSQGRLPKFTRTRARTGVAYLPLSRPSTR